MYGHIEKMAEETWEAYAKPLVYVSQVGLGF